MLLNLKEIKEIGQLNREEDITKLKSECIEQIKSSIVKSIRYNNQEATLYYVSRSYSFGENRGPIYNLFYDYKLEFDKLVSELACDGIFIIVQWYNPSKKDYKNSLSIPDVSYDLNKIGVVWTS